jgi:DNA processing protein
MNSSADWNAPWMNPMINGNTDNTAVILALASLGKIGPIKIKIMLAQAEAPVDIIEWDMPKLTSIPGIGSELAERITRDLDIDQGRRLVEWAGKNGYDIVTLVDSDYPAPLRDLYDPPPFLFVKGSLVESDYRAVAMVGSRGATDYGRTTATRLADELSRHGVTIVSGMALGIDAASHRGALAAGGRTIAVLGSGIDVIYPRENRGLYAQIADNGAVISEFLPKTDPNPGHFPRRNRIIAGLSRAVIVIEAGEKSGALLTADMALVYGRELFAVPGNVSSKTSEGAHELLKAGANILTSVEDIFSVLPELKTGYIAPRKPVIEDLTEGERRVLEKLSSAPVQLDTLVRECGLTIGDAASFLLSLELRGLVKQLSGKRFIAV